jgi:hypothetical protein
MESEEREYLAMAKARISGSAPWTAKTSDWVRAPGGRKDSLDISIVSRTEYGMRECPRAAGFAPLAGGGPEVDWKWAGRRGARESAIPQRSA